MTVKEVFDGLLDKYGDEFNWGIISNDKKEYFVNELSREMQQEIMKTIKLKRLIVNTSLFVV